MANIIEHVLRIQDDATKALEEVGDAADELSESLEKNTASAKEFEEGLVNMGKAAALVGAAVIGSTQALADYKNAINDASSRTGVAADTLAGLKLAAEGSGLAFGAVESALAPLNKRILDTARGTGEAKVAFDALGIGVTNADGSLRDADAVLQETLAALQGVDDTGTRAALATQAFGEAGTRLLQALSGTELEVFVEQAAELGPSFRDGGAGAAEFERAMAELKLVSMGALEDVVEVIGGESGIAGAVTLAAAAISGLGAYIASFMGSLVEDLQAMMAGISQGFEALERGDFSGAFAAFGSAVNAASLRRLS